MAVTIDMMIDKLQEYCTSTGGCSDCELCKRYDDETDELTDMLGCSWDELGDYTIRKIYREYENMNTEIATRRKTKNSPSDTTRYDKHATICTKLTEIYKAKNTDYGNSFGETFKKLGIISAVTRMSDKMNRLETLAVNHDAKIKDEKIEDTLMDMANYAIMTLIELGYEVETNETN